MLCEAFASYRNPIGDRTLVNSQRSLVIAVAFISVSACARPADAMVELVSHQATVTALAGLGDDVRQVTGNGSFSVRSHFSRPGADIYASGTFWSDFFFDSKYVSSSFPELGPGTFAALVRFDVLTIPEIYDRRLLSESGFSGSAVAQASVDYSLRFRVAQSSAIAIITANHEFDLTDTGTGERLASLTNNNQRLHLPAGEYELKQSLTETSRLNLGVAPVPEPATIVVWGLLLVCVVARSLSPKNRPSH